MVKDLISSHTEHEITSDSEISRKEFAGTASKYARYEPINTVSEIQSLLNELLMCENCALSPNGYSTFFEIPKCDFIKRFGRL
ncbi:MAG: hypothetical protein K2L13_00315 [Opitutales bacterium]|nr:hypothetical protein [Opitutales bacterium]